MCRVLRSGRDLQVKRFPARELWFLAAALGLMAAWSVGVGKAKVIPLGVLAALAIGIVAWLRRSATRSLATVGDPEFLRSCDVGPEYAQAALHLRSSIGRAFGVPPERISGEMRLQELMNLTGWFGSDLLALSEVQRALNALAPNAGDARPERTIRELVQQAAGVGPDVTR